MTSLTLYTARGSAVEAVDPRAKIVAAVLVVGALVVADWFPLKAAIVAFLIVLWFTARLSAKVLAITSVSLSFFFLTTLVLRAILRPVAGSASTRVWFFSVSHAGLLDGLQMCLQILGIVLALSLLVRTTPPVVFAEGLELLLSPFKRIGAPVHESVITFSIAMRFLPIMSQEFGRLQTAQFARGGGLHRGNVFLRARGVLPLLIPLFMVTLVRAKDLSEAMEARGYRGDVGRSSIRIYRFRWSDAVFVALPVLALVAAVIGRLRGL